MSGRGRELRIPTESWTFAGCGTAVWQEVHEVWNKR